MSFVFIGVYFLLTDAIETKGEGLTIKENILGVIFTDGTSIKLLESLPDANKN